MPEGLHWAQLRFKNHYEDWVAKNDELYYLDKLVITKDKVHSILTELYKDPNATSNSFHFFFNLLSKNIMELNF